jgi:hypothetical protein
LVDAGDVICAEAVEDARTVMPIERATVSEKDTGLRLILTSTR